VVSPPPKGTTFGRIAFATALADTAAECREALAAAQAALRVDVVPADLSSDGSDRPHRG